MFAAAIVDGAFVLEERPGWPWSLWPGAKRIESVYIGRTRNPLTPSARAALAERYQRILAGLYLHPAGRCTCCGEGACEWCRSYEGRCPECGRSGDYAVDDDAAHAPDCPVLADEGRQAESEARLAWMLP